MLAELLEENDRSQLIRLEKELGETHIQGQDSLNTPIWNCGHPIKKQLL